MTTADAIALYAREKTAYLKRTASKRDAVLESVRRQLAGEQEIAAEKRRGRGRKPVPGRTLFKCGHPITPENTYVGKKATRTFTYCRQCKIARHRSRRVPNPPPPPVSKAQRDRRAYDRARYAANAERMRAEARDRYQRRTKKQAGQLLSSTRPILYTVNDDA